MGHTGAEMTDYYTIRWLDGIVSMIDQRYLPQQEIYRDYRDVLGVAQAIHDMVIRGAPAIGAAAGFGMALAAQNSKALYLDGLMEDLHLAASILRNARPTAVNLNWALKRILGEVEKYLQEDVQTIRKLVLATALKIAEDDIKVNQKIGRIGSAIVPDNANIIHHCNTGSLAVVEWGTALGVIRTAHEQGKKIHILVDQCGAPLAIHVTGANENDKWYAAALILSILIKRPTCTQHFCADKAYDSWDVHVFVKQQGYIPHIKHRRRVNEPKDPCPIPGEHSYPPRRWVSERTLGWLVRRRSIRTRWCKKPENWLALIQLACAHIVFDLAVFG